MPSLINNAGNPDRDGAMGNALAQNYRKSAPSTRFGTPELIHLQVSFNDYDMTDYTTVDGHFNKVVTVVQRFAEIYAIGQAQYGGNTSQVTFILKAGTVTDPDYSNTGTYDPENDKSNTLAYELTEACGQSASTYYTTMFGFNYN